MLLTDWQYPPSPFLDDVARPFSAFYSSAWSVHSWVKQLRPSKTFLQILVWKASWTSSRQRFSTPSESRTALVWPSRTSTSPPRNACENDQRALLLNFLSQNLPNQTMLVTQRTSNGHQTLSRHERRVVFLAYKTFRTSWRIHGGRAVGAKKSRFGTIDSSSRFPCINFQESSRIQRQEYSVKNTAKARRGC